MCMCIANDSILNKTTDALLLNITAHWYCCEIQRQGCDGEFMLHRPREMYITAAPNTSGYSNVQYCEKPQSIKVLKYFKTEIVQKRKSKC